MADPRGTEKHVSDPPEIQPNTQNAWLDPEKIPAQAGFEPGTFRSRVGRRNH